MKKEFNLSEKIEKWEKDEWHGWDCISTDNIKEFIKMSNEDLDLVRTGKMSISKFIRRFKQRAGDDLK